MTFSVLNDIQCSDEWIRHVGSIMIAWMVSLNKAHQSLRKKFIKLQKLAFNTQAYEWFIRRTFCTTFHPYVY